MAEYHTIDLGRMALRAGEARRMELDLAADELSLGGQTYEVSHDDPARLDISRTLSGYALRLRFGAALDGPCMRCLSPSRFETKVDAREIDQPVEDLDQPSETDAELMSPYVDADILDVQPWAHDALLLAIPQSLWCRRDCAGLCPVCGVSLNDADPGHTHEADPDPRWAKLRELGLD